MENSKNGKIWQLAFWFITVICGVWFVALTQGVIANDTSSKLRDDKLTECINRQYTEIVQRLTRIETKIENSK